MPDYTKPVKRRALSQVIIKLMVAVQKEGFKVEYLDDCGGEFLVAGYGQAVLAKALPKALQKIINKLAWHHAHDGHKIATDLLTRYANGEFLK